MSVSSSISPSEVDVPKPPSVAASNSSPVKETIPSPAKSTQLQNSAPHPYNPSQTDTVDQSLTDKLKNDLGLGSTVFGSSLHSVSPGPKPEHSHSSKGGIIEWATDAAPSTDLDFNFTFGSAQPASLPRESTYPQESRIPEAPKAEVSRSPLVRDV